MGFRLCNTVLRQLPIGRFEALPDEAICALTLDVNGALAEHLKLRSRRSRPAEQVFMCSLYSF